MKTQRWINPEDRAMSELKEPLAQPEVQTPPEQSGAEIAIDILNELGVDYLTLDDILVIRVRLYEERQRT